jgi:hypothetical protein
MKSQRPDQTQWPNFLNGIGFQVHRRHTAKGKRPENGFGPCNSVESYCEYQDRFDGGGSMKNASQKNLWRPRLDNLERH